MKPVLIIAAVFAIGVPAAILMSMKEQQPAATAPVVSAPQLKTTNIYVAAQAIPVGTRITAEMLAIQPWPENLKLDGFISSDGGGSSIGGAVGLKNSDGSATAPIGFVARASFQQGEPIIGAKLANPSDPNFLAGELPKGMRVVSIMTTETDGVAGFVFPGDRVDVMVTHDVEDARANVLDASAPQIVKNSVTETLLTNVKVVAVDQRASGAKTTDDQGKLIVPRSVSLMVSPTDAQRLRLSQKVGTLTLALRSLEDRDSSDPLTVTSMGDISQYKESGVGAYEAGGTVKIYRGAISDKQENAAATAPSTPAALPAALNQPSL